MRHQFLSTTICLLVGFFSIQACQVHAKEEVKKEAAKEYMAFYDGYSKKTYFNK